MSHVHAQKGSIILQPATDASLPFLSRVGHSVPHVVHVDPTLTPFHLLPPKKKPPTARNPRRYVTTILPRGMESVEPVDQLVADEATTRFNLLEACALHYASLHRKSRVDSILASNQSRLRVEREARERVSKAAPEPPVWHGSVAVSCRRTKKQLQQGEAANRMQFECEAAEKEDRSGCKLDEAEEWLWLRGERYRVNEQAASQSYWSSPDWQVRLARWRSTWEPGEQEEIVKNEERAREKIQQQEATLAVHFNTISQSLVQKHISEIQQRRDQAVAAVEASHQAWLDTGAMARCSAALRRVVWGIMAIKPDMAVVWPHIFRQLYRNNYAERLRLLADAKEAYDKAELVRQNAYETGQIQLQSRIRQKKMRREIAQKKREAKALDGVSKDILVTGFSGGVYEAEFRSFVESSKIKGIDTVELIKSTDRVLDTKTHKYVLEVHFHAKITCKTRRASLALFQWLTATLPSTSYASLTIAFGPIDRGRVARARWLRAGYYVREEVRANKNKRWRVLVKLHTGRGNEEMMITAKDYVAHVQRLTSNLELNRQKQVSTRLKRLVYRRKKWLVWTHCFGPRPTRAERLQLQQTTSNTKNEQHFNTEQTSPSPTSGLSTIQTASGQNFDTLNTPTPTPMAPPPQVQHRYHRQITSATSTSSSASIVGTVMMQVDDQQQPLPQKPPLQNQPLHRIPVGMHLGAVPPENIVIEPSTRTKDTPTTGSPVPGEVDWQGFSRSSLSPSPSQLSRASSKQSVMVGFVGPSGKTALARPHIYNVGKFSPLNSPLASPSPSWLGNVGSDRNFTDVTPDMWEVDADRNNSLPTLSSFT